MNTSSTPIRSATATRPSDWLLRAAPLAGLAALLGMLWFGGGGPQAVPEGLPDPGPVTGWGLPLSQWLTLVAAIGVTGSVLAGVLSAQGRAGELSGVGLRGLRWSSRLAVLAAVAEIAQIAFNVSDQFGVPLSFLGAGPVFSFAAQTGGGQALVLQLLLHLLVAVGARFVLAAREAVSVLAVSVLAMLPTALTGHAADSGNHDTAVISLALHVVVVLLWAGGVVGIAWHLGGSPEARARALLRFSPLAAWCFWLTAASGAVNAAARLGKFDNLVGSPYGLGVLAKVAVLVALGLIAQRLRRRLRDSAGAGVLLAQLGAESVLLAVAVGLGVGLSRTPYPLTQTYTTPAQTLAGIAMPPPPTFERLLFTFSPSGVGFLVVGLGAAAYVVGMRTLRRRHDAWPWWRAVMWAIGLALVGWATFGGLGTYGRVLFSAHMGAHMVIGMVAPVFLVLGSPIQLALRALPGADTDGGEGPRQVLARLLGARYVRFFTTPVVAGAMFAGSLYLVYFTPLFTWLMENHLGHALMELHFLIAGTLFYEVILGSSLPRQPSYLGRLLLLLGITPFHAFFGITLMSSTTPVGESFYAQLQRPWRTDLVADSILGGTITWATGELPMVIVAIALVFNWYAADRRTSRRHDRREEQRGDHSELAEYNRRLQQMAEAEERRGPHR